MTTPKITQSLDLRAQQQLVMTPQLQQAISLLQMTNLELDAYLEEQITQNPLLEKEDPDRPDVSVEDIREQDNGDDGSAEDEFDAQWDRGADEPSSSAMQDFDGGTSRIGAGGNSSFDDPDFSTQDQLTNSKTLRDHIYDQIQQSIKNPADRAIATLLADRLDDAGYLRINVDELSLQWGVQESRIEDVLETLRAFDPPGIFAKDLPDCLRLQLVDKGIYNAPYATILSNLDLVAAHDRKKLAHMARVDDDVLDDMLLTLKTLNPKPGASFTPLVVQTAIPDVLMRKLPKHVGGGWRVELNAETLPRVLINQTYYQDVLSHAKTSSDKSYLQTQMNDASFLVRALDQRAQTILKVAADIIERQNAFFLYGIEFLTPMTLRDVAETIDMHESTVSRVTTGKYIGTPRGIFEMKFFFSGGLSGAGGIQHSTESIRARIKTMIDQENIDDILSDESIAQILQREGVDIARRTVAKYREGMGIETSTLRRKIKKNKANT